MRQLIVLSALLRMIGTCPADDEILHFQVEPGQVFHYEANSHKQTEVEVPDLPAKTTQDLAERVRFDLTVLERTPERVRFRKSLGAERMSGTSNGLLVDYDSERGDPLAGSKDSPAYMVSRMIGQSFEIRVSMEHRVVEILECDKLIGMALDGLPADHPARQSIRPEALMVTLADQFLSLPHWTIRPLSKWSERRELFSDFGLHCSLRRQFTFEGISMMAGRLVARVTTDSTPEFKTDQEGFGQVVQTSGHQRVESSIDASTGMLVMSRMDESLELQLASGAPTPVRWKKYHYTDSCEVRLQAR